IQLAPKNHWASTSKSPSHLDGMLRQGRKTSCIQEERTRDNSLLKIQSIDPCPLTICAREVCFLERGLYKRSAQQNAVTQGVIMQEGLPQTVSLQQGFRTIGCSQVSQIEHGVTSIDPAQVSPTQVGTTEVGASKLTTRSLHAA